MCQNEESDLTVARGFTCERCAEVMKGIIEPAEE